MRLHAPCTKTQLLHMTWLGEWVGGMAACTLFANLHFGGVLAVLILAPLHQKQGIPTSQASSSDTSSSTIYAARHWPFSSQASCHSCHPLVHSIQKLEMLEGRMVELASRLETQLERTFHLHSQQQLQQQQRAATNAAQPPPQQRPASQQPSDSEHTAPRGQQGAGDGGGGRAAPGVSTAELHLLMAQLQRMEEQEAAIRQVLGLPAGCVC